MSTELAAGAHGSLTPTIDPFLYTISAVVREGRTLAEVEAALGGEFGRLAAEPVQAGEMAQALERDPATTPNAREAKHWHFNTTKESTEEYH